MLNVTSDNSKDILNQFATAAAYRGLLAKDSKALLLRDGTVQRRGSWFFCCNYNVGREANTSLRRSLLEAIRIEYGTTAANSLHDSLIGLRGDKSSNLGAIEVRAAFERARTSVTESSRNFTALFGQTASTTTGTTVDIDYQKPSGDEPWNTLARQCATNTYLQPTIQKWLQETLGLKSESKEKLSEPQKELIWAFSRDLAQAGVQFPNLPENERFARAATTFFLSRVPVDRLTSTPPPEHPELIESPNTIDLKMYSDVPDDGRTHLIPEVLVYRAGSRERAFMSHSIMSNPPTLPKSPEEKSPKGKSLEQKSPEDQPSKKDEFPFIVDLESDPRLIQFKKDEIRSNPTQRGVKINGEPLVGTDKKGVEVTTDLKRRILGLYPEDAFKGEAAFRDLASVLHQMLKAVLCCNESSLPQGIEAGCERPWVSSIQHGDMRVKREDGRDSILVEMGGADSIPHLTYNQENIILNPLAGKGRQRSSGTSDYTFRIRYTPPQKPTDLTEWGRFQVIDVIERIDVRNLPEEESPGKV